MSFKLAIFIASIIGTTAIGSDFQKNKSQVKKANDKETPTNLIIPDTAGQLMNENEFWKLIENSRVAAKNRYTEQISALKTLLVKLENKEIEKFNNRFTALLVVSYDWKLWGAAYVINGGCSDDCFDYFRQYLIRHGKNRFYQTIKDPESCAGWIKSEEQEGWEGLQYCAMDAYKQKTGKELPKSYNPKFELKGKPFDEETVSKQYPKLSKKFMNGG